MNALRQLVSCLAMATSLVQAANEIPEMGEYAWQFPISVVQPTEYLATEIPMEVYGSVADPDLRDIGVYNAAGEAVPRMVQYAKKNRSKVEHETLLPLVPLYGELQQSSERLRLLMQSSRTGTSLQLDSATPDPDEPISELRAYLVDLRDLKDEAFTELSFEWGATRNGFIGNVTVEDGDDLLRWRHIAHETLADLQYEGAHIERNRVKVSGQLNDFLRITWRDMPKDWQLESLGGIRTEQGPAELAGIQTVGATSSSDDGREYVFDLAGYPPVDRLNLGFQQQNVVVRASFDFRASPEAAWRHTYEGLFYRISRNGNVIASEWAPISPVRARQWRVRIHAGRVDDINLKIAWRTEKLVFLAQGPAPYTLATGRAQDSLENFPQHRLLGDRSIFDLLEDSGEPGMANIGERQVAAGALVMKKARIWTWKTVLVWVGLLAAVMFVGWLVWSLMRENRKEPEG